MWCLGLTALAGSGGVVSPLCE